MLSLLILLPSLILADRSLTVTIAADNKWLMYVSGCAQSVGTQMFVGPTDAETENGLAWSNVKTIDKTLQGDGPWVVAVKATDYGTIAGFFANVMLDGQLFSVTGGSNSHWSVTDQYESGWTAKDFDDSHWNQNLESSDACKDPIWNSMSPTFYSTLEAKAPNDRVSAIWYPCCSTINSVNYFRLIIPSR
jgi:hypothetical protein